MKTLNPLLAVFLFSLFILGCSEDPVPEPVPEPPPYELADASKGGMMYDKFWSEEAGYDQTSTNLAKLNAYSDFFRCKQCHAWDGLGNAGSYINRGPRTSRPNISGLNLYQYGQTKSDQEIFDGLKKTEGRRAIGFDLATYNPSTNATEGDKMPNLTQLLSDAQLWDIVKFLKEGMFDVSLLYDATYTGTYPTGTAAFSNIGKDGNINAGYSYYIQKCVSCHGIDGKTLIIEAMSLGKFARSKPNEVQHKVKYGTLGTIMAGKFDISVGQMKDLYKALSNTTILPD